jgi:hypothetical protein
MCVCSDRAGCNPCPDIIGGASVTQQMVLYGQTLIVCKIK